MTSKKSNRLKPKRGIVIMVTRTSRSRAARKAATAVLTAAAAASSAAKKKAADVVAQGVATLRKANAALKPVGPAIVAPRKVAGKASKR